MELCLLLEQVGAAVAPVPVWPALVLGALPIAEFGSAAQRAALAPAGRRRGGDPHRRAVELPAEDPAAPTARAVRDGAGWRLDGVKDCVPAAHLAAAMLVPARTGEGQVGVLPGRAVARRGVTLERQIATNREPQARLTLERGARRGRRRARRPRAGASDRRVARRPRAPRRCARCELGVVGARAAHHRAVHHRAQAVRSPHRHLPGGAAARRRRVHRRRVDPPHHLAGRLAARRRAARERGGPGGEVLGRRRRDTASSTPRSTSTVASASTWTTRSTATTSGRSRSS